MKDQHPPHPRHLQLKVGDEVVFCPHRGHTADRGLVGVVVSITNHIEVWVKYNDVPAHSAKLYAGQRCNGEYHEATYNLRLASTCHTCVNRITHLSMGMCPSHWKSVRERQKKEQRDD